MNTKLLMIASSVFMGLIGLTLTFLPDKVLTTIGQMPNSTLNLILQITGALYFGFAITNWMAKTVLIGGIYARPLSIGNFCHFLIAGLALIKVSMNVTMANTYIYTLTFFYALFAILFGYIFLTHPNKSRQQ